MTGVHKKRPPKGRSFFMYTAQDSNLEPID
jgi:hypothetical protein